MKICYIYREKEKKEHSIENVFDTVSTEMIKLGHEVYKWYKPVSWNQCLKEIYKLRKANYDIYHITGDINYMWLFFPWRKTTMTIHDIGCYKNNSFRFIISLMVFVGMYLSSLVLKKLTAVSELTRTDCMNYLNIKKKKIEIIPNPLSLHVQPSNKSFNENCPIILQIGSGKHKNLTGLVKSINGIKCFVDIVGSPSDEDINMLKETGNQFKVSNNISNEQIVRKYEECDILYFVSHSEGFGMPIVEAQAVGRPVITADIEPTRTVAGGAAVLCDSNDYLSIRQGILSIINNPSYRNQLIADGYINSSKYKASVISKQYEAFYYTYYHNDSNQ